MKIVVKLMLLVLILSSASCELFDRATEVEFDMAFDSEVTIPSSSGLNLPFNLFTPEIETDSESKFAINNTKKDLVQDVNLTSLVLTITSPNSQRFDFLKEITFFINAEGLGEVEIAFADNIPDNIGNTLTLTVTDNNLRDYIVKDEFTLRVNTVTDQAVNQDVKIKVASTFKVVADVL